MRNDSISKDSLRRPVSPFLGWVLGGGFLAAVYGAAWTGLG